MKLEESILLRCQCSPKWSIDTTKSQSNCQKAIFFGRNWYVDFNIHTKMHRIQLLQQFWKRTKLEGSHYLIARHKHIVKKAMISAWRQINETK